VKGMGDSLVDRHRWIDDPAFLVLCGAVVGLVAFGGR